MSFDLSSSSDDESSVVEISALLTGVNNEDGIINSTTNNNSLSHHGDEPSDLNNDDGDDDDDGNNRIQQASSSSSTVIKETEKEFVNKKNCNDNRTRFVMGESVNAWRRHRNKAYNNSSILTQPTGSDTRINNTNNHPKYVMVQQKDDCISGRIDFKNAHVNVKNDDEEEDKVEIIVASTSSSTSLPVKAKRQLPHHENQTTASSSSSSSLLPAFVDCVAIWDSQRQVYVLEIPELVIKDVTMHTSAIVVGINKSLHIQKNDVHVHVNNDIRNNSALRQYDPLKQQQKAESKLLNHRKRRRS